MLVVHSEWLPVSYLWSAVESSFCSFELLLSLVEAPSKWELLLLELLLLAKMSFCFILLFKCGC